MTQPTTGARRLARLALAAAALAVAILVAAPGPSGLSLVLLVAATVVLLVLGLWLVVAHRGPARIAGGVVAAGAVAAAFALEIAHGLLWVAVVAGALLVAALLAGRAALRPEAVDRAESRAARAKHPFFVMNPRSGGGKVERFDLVARAERLGAEVALLQGEIDVAELARRAVSRGADLLGVAAGDGTQALVAGVAAAYGVPLLVVPAGTRNHFALDLGLDREDPARALLALTEGVDADIDLGFVNGRPFVNNVSFGAYAAAVARPDYRGDKLRVTLDVLPDVLRSDRGPPHLTVRTDGGEPFEASAVLVSNNPYAVDDVVAAGRRARLDSGVLGVVTVRVTSAAEAIGALRVRHSRALTATTAVSVVVDSDSAIVPVGVDGESLELARPVECRIRPHALRVRLPADRPGVRPPAPPVTARRLLQVAFGGAAADPRR